MSDSPSVHILLQIRKIIFDQFNDTNTRFTNDEIFEILKKNQNIDNTSIVDDMDPFFDQLHNEKLIRPIAQNFTTRWFKLFSGVEKFECNSCKNTIHLGKLEERNCPNPLCKASI